MHIFAHLFYLPIHCYRLDVNIVNSKGDTTLMLAARYNVRVASISTCDIKQLLSKLLKNGALINKRNNLGQNALEGYIIHSRQLERNIAILLFAAGELVDDSILQCVNRFSNLRVSTILEYMQMTDLNICLKQMCRTIIRKHLIRLNPESHLFRRIPQLYLQYLLTSYLLYDHKVNLTKCSCRIVIQWSSTEARC